MQLGRWSQKTEDGPQDALRIAKAAMAKAEALRRDMRDLGDSARRTRHQLQEHIAAHNTEMDKVYARRREVELEMKSIVDKQDADCDRITEVEARINKLTGVC